MPVNSNKKKLTFIDLFAGIGGIRLGFESAGFESVFANDFDPKASETYKANFGDSIDTSNIKDVIKDGMGKIPKKFDVLAAGFPCQPFSIAGHRLGFADKERGNLLFAVIEILRTRKPKAVFLENVKNLQKHDDEKTYKRIEEEMRGAGYTIKAEVLNSMHYGNVPQARERIYIVGFQTPRALMKLHFPESQLLTKSVLGLLEKSVDERFYYNEEDEFIYPKLKKDIKSRERVYQYRRIYVRENKNGVCPTLTASMGMGGHNVPIIKDHKGIRKLTMRECARLQGFPESFILPSHLSDTSIYKQIGNSVTVPVIAKIAENIRVALES